MSTSAKLILGAYGVAVASYVLLVSAALITGGRTTLVLRCLFRFGPAAIALLLAYGVALGLRDYVRQPSLRTAGSIGITIGGVAGALLIPVILLRPRLDVAQLRAAVSRDLPTGTQANRIVSYLDSLHISYNSAAPSSGPGPVAWTIQASVQDLRRPHLLSDGIFLTFRLDSSFKLIAAEVHESWTMP